MLAITRITKVEKTPYEETRISGGASGVPVHRELVVAPILSFFEICFDRNGETKIFEAEVRTSPHGEYSIDWGDDLQDFLMENECGEREFSTVSFAISDAYSKQKIEWPICIKK